MLDFITSNSAIFMTIVGLLAFMVSVITEVTKNLSFLKRIPTDLQVIVLSIGLCLLAYFSYTAYENLVVKWYYVTGSIVGGFLVAFQTLYGYNTLTKLYERFKR